MAITKVAPKYFLGAEITNPRIYAAKIDEMIEVINSLQTQLAAAQLLVPTAAQKAALDGAVTASGTNVFATMADL